MLSGLKRQTLNFAVAVHAVFHRDIRLAHAWGLKNSKPTIVVPGGGGVQMDMFYPGESVKEHTLNHQDKNDRPGIRDEELSRGLNIINPRGFRAYVKNEAFFRSIPGVLNKYPNTKFICPTMADNSHAQQWIDELGIHNSVDLLPHQSREQMAMLFRRSKVVVSPSFHDGTPNTLLEALACGCFPVAGDLESIREWITPGVNGILVDPANPDELADGILLALENQDLCKSARKYNLDLITRRANYPVIMKTAEAFYRKMLNEKV
jgi:hypothetical protein